MLNMKKGMALMLATSFAVLSACGQGSGTANGVENGANEAKNTATNAVIESEAPKQPVTIEFWYGLGGKLGDTMKEKIELFNSSQQDVIVKGIAQADYSETEQKLQAAIAAKQPPAAVLSSNMAWAKKGLFADMSEMIASDDSFNKDDFVQTFLEQGQLDDKQYFLPMYGTTQVMYYRKDALEKNGLTPDNFKTWEALAEAAAKMTTKKDGKTSFYGWEPMWGRDNMMDAVFSKGGTVLSEDGKTVMIDSPEWIETWELFRKWIHEDQIMSIHSGGQGWEYWYKTIDDVMKGNAAGYTGSSGDQGDLDFNIVAAMEQPGWEGVGAGKPVANAIMAGIPAGVSDEQKAAAYEWLTFFSQPENTAAWSISTGYIAVRSSALEDENYKVFSEQNPQIKVPLMQAAHASAPFQDPTGGKINDALTIAADKVQIGNVSAEQALKEAKATAQKELDRLK
ncbi:ABC transporter substrate-binding protein [Paenibacillus sinopodophylli]|uniref:ABC transporter substrate-binding protein n=1 Tax=Paenibacillus sinopodophylli TaxID=1837342 RepID=UPI00110D1CE5|nr:ABC transporter substrate-binding protein [Paenibacillus sinopodophylli]